jgi:hypothetical protein
VGDQLLAVAHEDAVVQRSRAHAPLHALDERQIFVSDLIVEGEEVVDPCLLDVRAEEVVEEAVGALRRQRIARPDRAGRAGS